MTSNKGGSADLEKLCFFLDTQQETTILVKSSFKVCFCNPLSLSPPLCSTLNWKGKLLTPLFEAKNAKSRLTVFKGCLRVQQFLLDTEVLSEMLDIELREKIFDKSLANYSLCFQSPWLIRFWENTIHSPPSSISASFLWDGETKKLEIIVAEEFQNSLVFVDTPRTKFIWYWRNKKANFSLKEMLLLLLIPYWGHTVYFTCCWLSLQANTKELNFDLRMVRSNHSKWHRK